MDNNGPGIISPAGWDDYELIDSGGTEKLECFGKWIILRPEPQAIWNKSLPEEEWQRLVTATFSRDKAGEERGRWALAKGMPRQWHITYGRDGMRFTMRLGLTAFKHVGVFPEQAANWEFIFDACRRIEAAKNGPARVLNLFAYTGGATLAARAAGASVTHVDSVKQVVTWARENAETSRLDGIRWITEDAVKFVHREVRRGNRYDGIILDPPAYGRGTDGEKWILERDLPGLLELCSGLLEGNGSFLVLNLYSMGLSALLARTAVRQLFGDTGSEQYGELYFDDREGKSLPLGVFYRFFRE